MIVVPERESTALLSLSPRHAIASLGQRSALMRLPKGQCFHAIVQRGSALAKRGVAQRLEEKRSQYASLDEICGYACTNLRQD